MRRLLLCAALITSGCNTEIPALDRLINGPSPTPFVNPYASAAPSQNLAYGGGALTLGTAETRALLPLLTDGAGHPAGGALTWVSLAPGIATVDANGQVKAQAQGSATIVVALAANPTIRAQIPVQVTANLSSVQVAILPDSPVVAIGQRVTLRGQVTLADGTINANVQWSSSDNTIATVNPTTGEVNGLKVGQVTIVGTYAQDGSYKSVANVKVVATAADLPNATPSTVVFKETPAPGTVAPGFDGSDGWTMNPIPLKAGIVTAVDFGDALHGVAVGDNGNMLLTADGGETWEPSLASTLVGVNLIGVDMVDAQNGYALASAGQGYLRTRDGGESWTRGTDPVDPRPNTNGRPFVASQLAFVDANTGYLVDRGIALKTTDGGATWAQVNTPADAVFYNIAVRDSKLWLLGQNNMFVYAAATGWSSVPTQTLATGIWSHEVSFPTTTTGWLVSGAGPDEAQITHDGGKTLQQAHLLGADGKPASGLTGSTGGQPNVAFWDEGHGVIGSGTHALVTIDGGATWAHKSLGMYQVAQAVAGDARNLYLLAKDSSRGGSQLSPFVLVHYSGH